MTTKLISYLGATLLVALLAPAAARAYCSGSEDTCPADSGSLRVVEVCASGGCSSAESISGVNRIGFVRRSSDNRVRACVCTNPPTCTTFSLRALRDVGTTSEMTDTTMDMNWAFCAGADADIISVASSSGSCNSTNYGAWSYSGYQFQIRGQTGADQLTGGSGDDQLCGGSSADGTSSALVSGNSGNDDLDGGSGDDYLDGGLGNSDQVWGYTGADYVLDGGGTSDELYGEAGNEACIMDSDSSYVEINCNNASTTCGGADSYTSDVVGHNTPWCSTNNIISCDTADTSCWLF